MFNLACFFLPSFSSLIKTYICERSLHVTIYNISLHHPFTTEGNNVALTVVRSGALGTVMVYWTTGLTDSTIANGSIIPDRGSFQMNPTDTSAQIILTVCMYNISTQTFTCTLPHCVYFLTEITSGLLLCHRSHHVILTGHKRCLP